jgi:hypothetical protein
MCRHDYGELNQLSIIEGLPFAPLEYHNVTVKQYNTPRMRLNFLDYSFQSGEGGWFVRADFDTVSRLKSQEPVHYWSPSKRMVSAIASYPI